MTQRLFPAVLATVLTMSMLGWAQEAKPAPAKETRSSSQNAPDRALMDQIWAAWSSGNPDNAARFYAKGAGHTFFDIAPLKYNSWDEYESGVKKVLAGFSSLKATVNDDARIHHHGNLAWGTATVHHVDVMKNGSRSEGDFRWTVIWEKQGNNWLITHEHVSEPAQ